MSVGTLFDFKHNSLNTWRLIFAALVIVSHSYPIGGFGPDPRLGDFTLGHFAVAAFFVASGFLITRSREKPGTSLVLYAWARVIRIFPAFWMCLFVTAFVAAPLAALSRGGWDLTSATTYVTSNSLLRMRQYDIGETLAGAPFPSAWNGSLWTLYYEFGCYVLVGLLLTVPAFRRGWWLLAAFAITTVASVTRQLGYLGDLESQAALWAFLVPYFFAGAVLYRHRHAIPARGWLCALAAASVIVATVCGWGETLAPLPLAYVVIWLAAVTPQGVERIGAGNVDISYGLYVYAFPVQQLLVLASVHTVGGPAGMIVASVALTIIPAAMSWFLVEKPALKLRRPSRTGSLPIPT